jgi:hypothetical protein
MINRSASRLVVERRSSRASRAGGRDVAGHGRTRRVAEQLEDAIAGGDPKQAKALLRLLIKELRVNGKSQILPTYRVLTPEVCATPSSVGATWHRTSQVVSECARPGVRSNLGLAVRAYADRVASPSSARGVGESACNGTPSPDQPTGETRCRARRPPETGHQLAGRRSVFGFRALGRKPNWPGRARRQGTEARAPSDDDPHGDPSLRGRPAADSDARGIVAAKSAGWRLRLRTGAQRAP